MPSLSIVIPAHNEEANIAETVDKISRVVQTLGLDYEIIVVNDDSSDRTSEILRGLMPMIANLKIVECFPNRGYGAALKAGFTVSTKELIAITPADLQFKFDEIRLLLDNLTPEVVLVSGRRNNRNDNLVRKFYSIGWNAIVRLMFGTLIKDIDSGFKVFRRAILENISIKSNGAMIDTEMLVQIRASHYKIVEIPVTHMPRTAGQSTGANPKVVLQAFYDLLRFRRQWLREQWNEKRAEPRNRRSRDNFQHLPMNTT